MAQFARPDADTYNADGWTSPAWSLLDEVVASDADKAVTASAPTSDVLVVSLSDVEDPVSSAGHVVRYRYQKSAAGGAQIDLTVQLRQGYVSEASLGTLIAGWTHTNIANGWTTAAQTLIAAEADAITNYASLYLRFLANQV